MKGIFKNTPKFFMENSANKIKKKYWFTINGNNLSIFDFFKNTLLFDQST